MNYPRPRFSWRRPEDARKHFATLSLVVNLYEKYGPIVLSKNELKHLCKGRWDRPHIWKSPLLIHDDPSTPSNAGGSMSSNLHQWALGGQKSQVLHVFVFGWALRFYDWRPKVWKRSTGRVTSLAVKIVCSHCSTWNSDLCETPCFVNIPSPGLRLRPCLPF